MSKRNSKSNSVGFNGLPRSTRTTRTKTVIPEKVTKSSSAVSARTYSRMNDASNSGLMNGISPGSEDLTQLNESYTDLEGLRGEKELLDRMLDQQKQLKELKERQKRVLLLQQQLAEMEANAEESLEEKLDKLQTAKTRLDELQTLVTAMKSAESADDVGEGHIPQPVPDKATRVRKALQELNQLKDMIGMMSSDVGGAKQKSQRRPVATMEPVFPNAIKSPAKARDRLEDNYQSILPEVSVIQTENSLSQPSYKSPKRKSKDLTHHSSNAYLPYQKPVQAPSQNKTKTIVAKSTEKEPEDIEATLRLFEEMRRHQKLLQELKDRREELETLMNMTNGCEHESEERQEPEDEYNDTNASVRSNNGSNVENRYISDDEAVESEINQSGQLFGLSEVDTQRVIDLIRSQKLIGATTTDKTTATWGSSTSGSDDDEDEYGSPVRPSQIKADVTKSRENSPTVTSVKDAFTQMNLNKEHEIDFRPPTRRRRNITQSEAQNRSLIDRIANVDIGKLQEALSASNSTMHILLEDQQALSKLLLNTISLQRNAVSSQMCYGISPDFLIYQLDNCSAQFATMMREIKEIQWQLYCMTKGEDNMERCDCDYSEYPLPTLPDYLSQRNTTNLEPSGIDSFQLQVPSLSEKAQDSVLVVDDSLKQSAPHGSSFSRAQKEVESAEADLFEALRDSIYSEAAILISQNEARPHFLVELFHTLQQVNTDYMRQHALYALQDVVRGYLPNSARKINLYDTSQQSNQPTVKILKRASFSENTPSETSASSEEEAYEDLKPKVPEHTRYDLSFKVSSESDISSPSDDENTPFAADDLGSTVIHLDAAIRHMREVERMKQEIKSPETSVASPASSKKMEIPPVNTKVLRAWIKNIVSEIIPILKVNHDKLVDKKLVKKMHRMVYQCISKDVSASGDKFSRGEAPDVDKIGIREFFDGQLKSLLKDCFSRFIGQRVGSCGEDVIVGLSEVLFNELAFLSMMQELGKENHDAANGGGDVNPQEESCKKVEVTESDPSPAVRAKDDDKNEDSEISNADDGVAVSGEGSVKNTSSHGSADPVTFDLSASETKPLTSYGSGEDEEDGSGEDYDYKEPEIRTSVQQDSDSAVEPDDDKEVCDTKPQNHESDN